MSECLCSWSPLYGHATACPQWHRAPAHPRGLLDLAAVTNSGDQCRYGKCECPRCHCGAALNSPGCEEVLPWN